MASSKDVVVAEIAGDLRGIARARRARGPAGTADLAVTRARPVAAWRSVAIDLPCRAGARRTLAAQRRRGHPASRSRRPTASAADLAPRARPDARTRSPAYGARTETWASLICRKSGSSSRSPHEERHQRSVPTGADAHYLPGEVHVVVVVEHQPGGSGLSVRSVT